MEPRRASPGACLVAWVVCALGGCGAAPPPPHAVPDARACVLAAPVTPGPVTPVDGYPVPVRELDAAQLVAREAQLSSLVPGWQIVLSPSGYPTRLEHEVAGEPEPRVSEERVARVRALVAALAPELGWPDDVQVAADGPYVWVGVQRPTPSMPQAIAQQVPPVEGSMRLRVEIVEPAPQLPEGQRSDALIARWAVPGQAVAITTEPSMPCDPVGPNDCRAVEPRSRCLLRDDVTYRSQVRRCADGFRRVADLESLHCAGCFLETRLPHRIDALTGESLDDRACW